MMTPPVALTAACLLFVIALLVVDRLQWPLARAFTKLGASTCFVWLAIVLGAMQSRYGQWVLGALVLGWLGDALLLGKRSAAFMAGLVAFLLSHGLYATAFVSGPLNGPAMAVALVAACAAGFVVLRWLLPHTPARFKAPVLVYVVVILSMCVAAVGHAVATGRWIVLGGAVLFAISDIAVARERFVRASPVNHLWGWPTYFVAQVLLAWSVATTASLH
ncbi:MULTISPECIES: lysoplasmalogenase [unclassified Hydrogenophaga]|uniref:lysoplasmalogenase n=1 Tax=unclassified Hydrogenophaga TaxID=2610897 RepID=UPI000AEE531F|nr:MULTISPECIES: lysoplasmalogenase [unclassified Hydrogenophaga]MBN9372710.1 lysoplasmalogenase [Hydrogenophaga sp.]